MHCYMAALFSQHFTGTVSFTVISLKRIEVLFTSVPVASKIAPNEDLTFFYNFPQFFRYFIRHFRKTAYISLRPQILRGQLLHEATNRCISLKSLSSHSCHTSKTLQPFLSNETVFPFRMYLLHIQNLSFLHDCFKLSSFRIKSVQS